MKKEVPKVPKEKQKGTFMPQPHRLEGVVAKKGNRAKKKKKQSTSTSKDKKNI